MSESSYIFFILNNAGGWGEIDFTFDIFNDDEPINVFCGNSDPTNRSSTDPLNEYFLVHTLKGNAYILGYLNNSEVKDPIPICEDIFIDHAYCMHDYIFISSEKELRVFTFDLEKVSLSLVGTINLPAPVLSMKSSSTDSFTLFIHLRNYSLKMFRRQNPNILMDIESNILLYDVCGESVAFIDNNLNKRLVHFNSESPEEAPKEKLEEIPINIYLRYNENSESFSCICEYIPGEAEIDGDTLHFSKLISKHNSIIYCNDNCSNLSFLNEDFFESNDHIILFDQFNYSRDVVVIIRPPDFGLYPRFINRSTEEELDCQLNAINIQTGEMDLRSPLVHYYDSNIFLASVLYLLTKEEKIFEERIEKIVQILNFIVDNFYSLIDTFLLSRILNNQFFSIALNSFKPDEELQVSPFSIACLAILINKAIKIASCKFTSKMLFLLRTEKDQIHPQLSIIPPVLSQFNQVHEISMLIIENIPEEFAQKTLSSLLPCLKYTRCDIIRFADYCFKLNVIEDLNENSLFLFRKLLILGNTVRNDNLPDLVRLLLFSYNFISLNDPNNELLNKIRDFFEHKPQDLDSETMIKIQLEFNQYILDLKPKFQTFLDQVRFYPQKDIAPEIQKFIKCHIPIPISDIDIKFREDIENLSKSGKLLRIKIEYINLIQDADDYITSCQSSRFSRKRGDF